MRKSNLGIDRITKFWHPHGMKTIFLDMDGVLNHTLFFRGRTKYPAKTIKRPYDQIDQESVENLNTLIQQTGAKVVISSTWRKHYDVAQMQEILNTNPTR